MFVASRHRRSSQRRQVTSPHATSDSSYANDEASGWPAGSLHVGYDVAADGSIISTRAVSGDTGADLHVVITGSAELRRLVRVDR